MRNGRKYTDKVKVAVLGAGSIGSLFGGYIALGGLPVTLIGREPHVREIRLKGLTIERTFDGKVIKVKENIYATTEYSEVEDADIILVTVKAYDTASACKCIKPYTSDKHLVICLQNGYGVEEIAKKVLNSGCEVVRAITSQAAQLSCPGKVLHNGIGDTFIQKPPSVKHAEQLTVLCKALRSQGITVKTIENITSMIWRKLVVNAAINPLATVMNVKNGVLLSSRYLKEILDQVIAELHQLCMRSKVLEASMKEMRDIVYRVIRETSNNINSMLQDMKKGKKTEIDFILKPFVELSQKYDVKAPVIASLYNMIKFMEEKT